jgi:hypothetical protein
LASIEGNSPGLFPVLPQGFQHNYDRMRRLAFLGYRLPENALRGPCATIAAALTQRETDGRSTRLLPNPRSPNSAKHYASLPVERAKAEYCVTAPHIDFFDMERRSFLKSCDPRK